MLKYKNVKTIEVQDWDKLVKDTYQRPYSFQQQEGCKPRGIFGLTIPSPYTNDDDMPNRFDGESMGVKFSDWLARDPKKKLDGQTYDWEVEMDWERYFYPDILTVANDLYAKGLIEAGEYVINIDW